jgi:hypothetical protein
LSGGRIKIQVKSAELGSELRDLLAQAGLIARAFVFVDGSLFNAFINNGESFWQELTRQFQILFPDGLTQFFDLGFQNGFVATINSISPQTAAPLSDCRSVSGHFFLPR